MNPIEQVYAHMNAVAELERTKTEVKDFRGHNFKVLMNTDSNGGGWSWIHRCECGAYYVVERKNRRSASTFTVITTDCPLPALAPAEAAQ